MGRIDPGVGSVVDIGLGRHIAVIYCPSECSCSDCETPSSWRGVRAVGSITDDTDGAADELIEMLDADAERVLTEVR